MKAKALRTKLLLLLPLVFFSGQLACRRDAAKIQGPFYFVDHLADADAQFDEARYRSFRKDTEFAAHVTLGDDTRSSLVPPLPSGLSFDVEVPPEPVLQFALAVKRLTDSEVWPPIEFRLTSVTPDGRETVFSEVVRRPVHDQWLDREVNLSPWAGEQIELVFETKIGRATQRIPWTARRILPVWGNPVLAGEPRSSAPAHLILISVDALRPDHMGIYGYSRDTTPHIDRFAAEGTVFDTAVSAAPWTLTSHMSMLTGLMPSLHGATRRAKLAREVPYLPELLAGAGYQTDAVVSNVYLSPTFGFERGFRIYQVRPRSQASGSVDAAIELLRRAKDRPQFLFLHLLDPHWPYLPPSDFTERFAPRPDDISDLLDKVIQREAPERAEEIQQLRDLYDAEIGYTDRELGRFMAELKALGIYDRSLIILTADHGEAFFEHEMWQHSDSLYEEMIRVPLIVKWPGSSPTGRVHALATSDYLLPTFLEEVDLALEPEAPKGLRHLLDPDAPADNRPRVVSEVAWDPNPVEGTSSMVSLRLGERKYIATLKTMPNSSPEILQEELFDLGEDPAEGNNLADSSPENLTVFRDGLRSHLERAQTLRGNRRGDSIAIDDVTKERLKALGYVIN